MSHVDSICQTFRQIQVVCVCDPIEDNWHNRDKGQVWSLWGHDASGIKYIGAWRGALVTSQEYWWSCEEFTLWLLVESEEDCPFLLQSMWP